MSERCLIKKLKQGLVRSGFSAPEFSICVEVRSLHRQGHTVATWLVQEGVSIYEVQKLLGHSNISVTQVYSHLAASELHGAVKHDQS
jgi:site-specific recombinase XerD